MAVLAEYVEGELAGRRSESSFPALAAHLRNCPACAEDYEGLLAHGPRAAAPSHAARLPASGRAR